MLKRVQNTCCKLPRFALLALAALAALIPGVSNAQDPLVPDVGFDSAATLTEMGTKLGGDMVLVVGVALAIFAIVFVVRALRRHARPS